MRYAPLCDFAVKHVFFSREAAPEFDFVPTAPTARLIDRLDLLVKASAGLMTILYDVSRTEVLQSETADPAHPLVLTFKAFTRDQAFKYITEPATTRDDAILFFENTIRGDATEVTLHRNPFVAEADFRWIEEVEEVTGLLRGRDFVVRPDFVVSLRITGDDFAGSLGFRSYRIRFDARRTIWKYYLLGHTRKDIPRITDPTGETVFEFVGKVALPGARTALAYRSLTPIPLRERNELRFQLRDPADASGKVFIRRLPVAAADRFGKDVIDGKETIVSEIFVNS
jgi:hypothetical protein